MTVDVLITFIFEVKCVFDPFISVLSDVMTNWDPIISTSELICVLDATIETFDKTFRLPVWYTESVKIVLDETFKVDPVISVFDETFKVDPVKLMSDETFKVDPVKIISAETFKVDPVISVFDVTDSVVPVISEFEETLNDVPNIVTSAWNST